jgi:hypothetical protein
MATGVVKDLFSLLAIGPSKITEFSRNIDYEIDAVFYSIGPISAK